MEVYAPQGNRFGQMSISPDGKTLAWQGPRDNGQGSADIWVRPLSRRRAAKPDGIGRSAVQPHVDEGRLDALASLNQLQERVLQDYGRRQTGTHDADCSESGDCRGNPGDHRVRGPYGDGDAGTLHLGRQGDAREGQQVQCALG